MTTTINQEAVQRQFGNVAANYRTSAVHAKGADMDAMIATADLRGDEIVLDAGCGAGHTALAFAPHVAHVTAYDLTPPMLEQVKKLAAERGVTNVATRQGDVQQLPFPDAHFDVVVSRYSAHHWPRPQLALREFARVLKPGRHFILSDIVTYEDLTQDTFLQTIELLRDPSHVRDHGVDAWLTMMAEAGFSGEVVFRLDVRLGFRSWLERMATPAPNAAMIKTLLAGASAEVQAAFQLAEGWTQADDFEFVIPDAVLKGKK